MKTLALFNKYSYVQQYKYMPTIMETLNTVLPPIAHIVMDLSHHL